MAIQPQECVAGVRAQEGLFIERAFIAQRSLRVHGNPYADKYVARFLDRVEVGVNGCWLWKSTLNNKGYARMGMYRRLILIHRWAYILLKGAIPSGLELDHLCETPRCVNPDHMEPVTHRENNLRGHSVSAQHARQTHCSRGHPFSIQNTYRKPGRNTRECRICKTERTMISNRRMQALRKAQGA